MCWFYMAMAQIALHPTLAVKRANVEKKVPQTILASLYTPPLAENAHMETTHLKKGLLKDRAKSMSKGKQ